MLRSVLKSGAPVGQFSPPSNQVQTNSLRRLVRPFFGAFQLAGLVLRLYHLVSVPELALHIGAQPRSDAFIILSIASIKICSFIIRLLRVVRMRSNDLLPPSRQVLKRGGHIHLVIHSNNFQNPRQGTQFISSSVALGISLASEVALTPCHR